MKKDESPRRARRREKLAELIAEVGNATQLANESGTPKSHVSAMLSGQRGLGDVLAEKLELIYAKPSGWFDAASSAVDKALLESEKSNVSEVKRRAKVPLISLIQAGEMSDVFDLFNPGESDAWVTPLYTSPSEQSYALRVEGDSMESPIPGALTFLEGTILVVDPNASTAPGDYVIAKDVATQRATFKKLTTDGVRFFLKPLNPAYQTVEIDYAALRIIGKVVEHQPPGGKL